MKTIQIKTGRQSNGLWGTPMNLVGMDKAFFLSPRLEELRSAIIIAIAEMFPTSSFIIDFSSDTGFYIKATNDTVINGQTRLRLLYKDYHLEGDTLYYLESEKDIRNLKLKSLSEK